MPTVMTHLPPTGNNEADMMRSAMMANALRGTAQPVQQQKPSMGAQVGAMMPALGGLMQDSMYRDKLNTAASQYGWD